MLQRIALGQARFNLPGLTADARGAALGRQLGRPLRGRRPPGLVPAALVGRAEPRRSAAGLSDRLRARRGGDARGDRAHAGGARAGRGVAHAARLAGGQALHRRGETLRAVSRGARAARLRRRRAQRRRRASSSSMAPSRPSLTGSRASCRSASCCCAWRWCGCTGARRAARGADLPDGAPGPRDGGGGHPAPRRRLRCVSRPAAMQAAAALCESAAPSAFSPGATFWIFRIERLPPRLYAPPRRRRPGSSSTCRSRTTSRWPWGTAIRSTSPPAGAASPSIGCYLFAPGG